MVGAAELSSSSLCITRRNAENEHDSKLLNPVNKHAKSEARLSDHRPEFSDNIAKAFGDLTERTMFYRLDQFLKNVPAVFHDFSQLIEAEFRFTGMTPFKVT